LQIEIGDERPPQTTVSSSQSAKMAQEAAAMDSSVPDPQMASLPLSNMEFNPIQHLPSSLNEHDTARTSTRSQPPSSEHKEHHHQKHQEDDAEDGTVVSSLTGAGLDQEIVEELHMALTDLRQELEESRAEAARAVKVAEQAIQSAENSSSKDWNSTVTHKAAEAAALAQKKSAEAMAKQRLAEERLEGEKRNANFWRKQAEASEEEAGALQTRAAAAEVQRAAIMEALKNEQRKGSALVGSMKQRFSSTELHQKQNLEATMERNRELEVELEATRRTLAEKELQASFEDDDKELGSVASAKKKLYGRIKDDGASRTPLAVGSRDSASSRSCSDESPKKSSASAPDVLRVYSEFTTVRKYRFERNDWTDLGFLHDLVSHTNCF
jgi:DNA-binding XRE family transcriptional regulator